MKLQWKEIKKLRDSGLAFPAIAKKYGLPPAGVQALYKALKTKTDREYEPQLRPMSPADRARVAKIIRAPSPPLQSSFADGPIAEQITALWPALQIAKISTLHVNVEQRTYTVHWIQAKEFPVKSDK